eukprot:5335011-Amphidinium_carterae.1
MTTTAEQQQDATAEEREGNLCDQKKVTASLGKIHKRHGPITSGMRQEFLCLSACRNPASLVPWQPFSLGHKLISQIIYEGTTDRSLPKCVVPELRR